jgi:hypothetical protein
MWMKFSYNTAIVTTTLHVLKETIVAMAFAKEVIQEPLWCKKKKFPIQQQEQQYVVPFICTLYVFPQVQDSIDTYIRACVFLALHFFVSCFSYWNAWIRVLFVMFLSRNENEDNNCFDSFKGFL